MDDVSPGGYRWTQAVLVVLMPYRAHWSNFRRLSPYWEGLLPGAVIEKQ